MSLACGRFEMGFPTICAREVLASFMLKENISAMCLRVLPWPLSPRPGPHDLAAWREVG